MFSRWLNLPVAASAFAGLLGAGVIDLGLIALRGADLRLGDAVALVLGLYGTLGVVVGALLGCAAAVVGAAIPGGSGAVGADRELDRKIATGLAAGAVGALVEAGLVGAGHALLIAKMHSKALATIAAFGVAALAVPVAVLVALAVWRPLAAVLARVPRLPYLSRTGLVVGLLVTAGLAATVFAFSRADWRVLDLGPAKAAALALALALAHWLFWYTRARADRLLGPAVLLTVRVVAVVGSLLLLLPASRLPEGATVFEALEEHGLGMRHLLALARGVGDRDGDGFAAAFGGGDCDDGNGETFPGAEEVPGDGIDQNCQGGDAAPLAAEPAAAPAAPAEPKRRAGPAFTGNILIISIDSLRADRLGVAGYRRRRGRSLTPTLDALAKSGAYFRRAWSHAPNTPRSFPALLTSRYPSEIAWEKRTLNYSPILPSNETFFEQLGRAGWKPVALHSHFYFSAERNLNQGFAEWNNDGARSIADSNRDTASPRLVPRVIARLKQAAARKERIVLWTHLFEPHSSYIEHPEFPSRLRGVEGLEERYDYEIAYVDRWIGRIVAALEASGQRKNTAIVIVSDHGEAWGEHKHFFHGQDLTEEQLRVPLIFNVPGRRPVVSDVEVALVDVGPTLLDLVGLEAPPSFRGRSLLPVWGTPAEAAEALPPKPVFAELLPANAWPKHEVMMVLGGKKIVHKITERRWELYDLGTDPRQRKDLARDPRWKNLFQELRAKVIAFEEGRR